MNAAGLLPPPPLELAAFRARSPQAAVLPLFHFDPVAGRTRPSWGPDLGGWWMPLGKAGMGGWADIHTQLPVPLAGPAVEKSLA